MKDWDEVIEEVLEEHKEAWEVMACFNHKEVAVCDCGKNTICFDCMNGQGSIPCDCTPKITRNLDAELEYLKAWGQDG